MSFLSSLGAEAKALARLTGPTNLWTRFNSYGGGYGGASYSGLSYGASLSGGSLLVNQSAQLDYSALVSDPLCNSVVALCVEKIATALRTAPLVLERRTDTGWQRVDDHPALDLLCSPNEDLSDVDVWGLTTAFKRTRGEAFWYIVPNRAGLPGEIYVWPRERIEVVGDEEHFIAGYRVQTESGQWIPLVDKRQIIHFRHLPNPYNARLGWTALHTGRAQMAGDNLSATYHTAILSNAGVVSLLISLKDGLQNGQVSPDQFQQVVNNIRRAGRERAGSVEGLNVPLEVHKLAYSPDEMGLEKLIDYYEGRLCALMGVDPMVAGLPAGDGRKTYSNLSEALNDFWERTLIPDRDADCATLNRQYLQLFGLDKRQWRLRADYSNVPALQANQDELHTRWREDYKAGGIDLYTFQSKIGLADVPEEFRGRFSGDKTPQGITETKAESNKPENNWNPEDHPRGGDPHYPSRFSAASGNTTPLHPTTPSLSFSTAKDATEWLQKTFEQTAKQLSLKERAAVGGFKTLTFDSINRALRGDPDQSDMLLSSLTTLGTVDVKTATVEEVLTQEVPALDNAIAHFQLPAPCVVERATDAPIWHSPATELEGKVIGEHGYQSTSVFPAFVENWLIRKVARKQYPRGGVVLEIHLPKGQNVLPMQPLLKDMYQTDDNQFELLLPRGGQMEVVKVIDQPQKPRRIIINWKGEYHGTSQKS